MVDLITIIRREITESREYLKDGTPGNIDKAAIHYQKALEYSERLSESLPRNLLPRMDDTKNQIYTDHNLELLIGFVGQEALKNPLQGLHLYFEHVTKFMGEGDLELSDSSFEKMLQSFDRGYSELPWYLHWGFEDGLWPACRTDPKNEKDNKRMAAKFRDYFTQLKSEAHERGFNVPENIDKSIDLIDTVAYQEPSFFTAMFGKLFSYLPLRFSNS